MDTSSNILKREYDPAYYFRENPGDRWTFRPVFEFSDGRETWRGGWNPAERFEDSAAAVSKANLLWASIEGKHFTTKEIKRFADCPGHEFVNFQRLAVIISNDQATIEHVHGMKLIATTYEGIALEDGSTRYAKRSGTGSVAQ